MESICVDYDLSEKENLWYPKLGDVRHTSFVVNNFIEKLQECFKNKGHISNHYYEDPDNRQEILDIVNSVGEQYGINSPALKFTDFRYDPSHYVLYLEPDDSLKSKYSRSDVIGGVGTIIQHCNNHVYLEVNAVGGYGYKYVDISNSPTADRVAKRIMSFVHVTIDSQCGLYGDVWLKGVDSCIPNDNPRLIDLLTTGDSEHILDNLSRPNKNEELLEFIRDKWTKCGYPGFIESVKLIESSNSFYKPTLMIIPFTELHEDTYFELVGTTDVTLADLPNNKRYIVTNGPNTSYDDVCVELSPNMIEAIKKLN